MRRSPRGAAVLLALTAAVMGGQAAAGRTALAGTYRVRAGDTLSHIARQTGATVSQLASLNGIRDVHRIFSGVSLRLPGRPAAAAPAPARPVSAPARLPERLRRSPERLALIPHFDAAARRYNVPADLLKAMTWMESGWQNGKVSRTNARGIGQLMPDTVVFVNRLLRDDLDPRQPRENIAMSARYLRFLLDRTGGDVPQALASYYQGPTSVRRIGWYEDTKRYVATVLALRSRFT